MKEYSTAVPFLAAEPLPLHEYLTSVAGKLLGAAGSSTVSRAWVLPNRSVVVCLPDETSPDGVRRDVYMDIVSAHYNRRSKLLTVTLDDQGSQILINGQGCGCNMGAVGNAGPVDGKHRIARVRSDDWYTEV